MRILVHSPIPFDGTSFYRAFGPFSHLQRKYQDIEIINGSIGGFEYNWHTLMGIDIVFVQRPSTSESLEIIKIAKRSKKPVWIDYDDDYICIPDTNPRFDLYSNPVRQSQIRECMRLADMITVSTSPIKESIVREVAPKAQIEIVPNAYDPFLFSLDHNEPREKIVFWRGGDTHIKDVEIYKEAILNCFDSHPEYTWVFYGHKFKWMIEHAIGRGEHHRIVTYEFNDLMHYFNTLMQIHPEIMIVPLEDNSFNRAKSNIALIEGTLAGATVMATNLPEFSDSWCHTFRTNADFELVFNKLAKNDGDTSGNIAKLALGSIPSLDIVNCFRYSIAHNLVSLAQKLKPVTLEAKPWDDKRFFEYGLINGYTQENPGYTQGHHAVADWLIETLKPESMIEFGSGPGAMLERFLTSNVVSLGLEINDYSIDYFRTRNPVFADFVKKVDFAVDDLGELQFDKTDLGISIEVFEHIDKPEKWWDDFISLLSKSFKHFYFTSTPNRASVQFDKQLGHCNVRQKEAWIDLFERNGWKYTANPMKICSWDMLFTSVNIAKG